MIEKILKSKIVLSLVVSVVTFLIIYWLTTVLYDLDKSIGQSAYSAINQSLKVSSDIVIVEIDEKTTGALGRFPFKRDAYIKLIENLNAAGASVIAFDIIFADKTEEAIDNAFIESVKQAGNIVLGGATLKRGGKSLLEHPLPGLEAAASGIGFLNPIIDDKTKEVYSVQIEKDLFDGTYVHFSVAILRKYWSNIFEQDFTNYSVEDRNFFHIAPRKKMPYHNYGGKEVNLNFVKVDSRYTKESFINIYNNSFVVRDPELVRNKIVIIGATAKGIKDVFQTPFGQKFGVYTHANMVNMGLTQEFKMYFNKI